MPYHDRGHGTILKESDSVSEWLDQFFPKLCGVYYCRKTRRLIYDAARKLFSRDKGGTIQRIDNGREMGQEGVGVCLDHKNVEGLCNTQILSTRLLLETVV
jgi:hypothetical protein